VFFTSGTLGTTAATPVIVKGELIAVVGADIELEALSEFLSTLPTGDHGGAVITNATGTIIAHPDPMLTRRETPGGLVAVQIQDLDADPIARQALRSVEGGVAGVVAISGDDGSAGTARATGRSIQVGSNRWAITIYADSRDFVGGIDEARRRDRQLLLAIGVVAALVGGIAMFPATRPIVRLAHEAATDPLTRVDNRRSISQRAHAAASERGSKTVALVDVDNMRTVNLTHGRLVGDEVLAEVATRLKGVVGSDGHVGRVAGEEFLLVFPRRSWEEVDQIIDGARRSVRGRPFETRRAAVDVTVSIGVASDLRRTDGETLIRSAADALAQAKRFGPDRVRVSHFGEDNEGLTHITVDLTGDTAVTRIVVPGSASD
jgi:diguanylate cyclase (GGDEF)-like protein